MNALLLGQAKLSQKELIWQGLIFSILAYTSIEAPLWFAVDLSFRPWQMTLELFFSLIFIIDIFNNRKLKIKRLVSSRHLRLSKDSRFSTTTLIDIVACIPFDLIAYLVGAAPLIKFIRILKLVKLLKIVNINRNVGAFSTLPSAVKFEVIIVSATIAIHWIACGWIITSVQPGYDLYTLYNKALYWAVTTLTTIGYGDIVPTTNIGRTYTMIIMIIGVGVYGFVIGNVFNLISQADRYKEQTKEKMSDLTLFMRHYDIPVHLQNSVFSYYNHLFTKRLSENDSKIIAELPNALQADLQTYMNMKLIGNVPAFKLCSHSCLKEIASSLEQMFFSPGQKIITEGEMGYEMYIIAHGSVEVISTDKGIIATLHEGQCFGEQALLEERKRGTTIRAQAYCDLYKLSKEDFTRIHKKHPDLEISMKKVLKLDGNTTAKTQPLS